MANDYYGKIGFRFRPEIERPDPKWAKKLMEEVKEVRKRKTLYQWQMPGITFKVIQ